MTVSISLRNVLHERRRFLASVAGVSFAVTLVVVQLSLFLGLAANASQIIDRNGGDLWVMSRNTRNFQWGRPIPRRSLALARSTPGVAWAEELLSGWTVMQDTEGGVQSIQLIGFDPARRIGGPWNVIRGDVDALRITPRLGLDLSAQAKIGSFAHGDDRHAGGRRVRIGLVTEGITSFTTVPIAFASLQTTRLLDRDIGPDDTVYVVVGLEPWASPAEVTAVLRARLPFADVHPTADFSRATRRYWMFETGMGVGFLLTSLLALAVGTVIVSQTMFAITADHLPEYGTLKAMGMPSWQLGAIVVGQGTVAGITGALPGAAIGAAVVHAIRAQGLEVVATPAVYAVTMAGAVVMAGCAALTSVRRVWRLDPAMVFRA
jgi:putative ABC transport system permease protein